jgi:hypothetical protein
MAGAIGGVIWTLIAIPMQLMMAGAGFQQEWLDQIRNNPDMPPELSDTMERIATGAAFGIFVFVFQFLASLVFGTLGGLLGVAIFKKSAPPPPPPGTIEVLPPQG